MKAQDFAALRDWPGYFKVVAGKPPRQTLIDALALFEAEWKADAGGAPASRSAMDVGCGEGRDTGELLARGWRVLAMDSTPEAFELMARGGRIPPGSEARLSKVVGSFFDPAVEWAPAGTIDLVNASYSLPFCPPGRFAAMWARIVRSIRPGGRFAGQLFGDRDGWRTAADMTFHRRGELDRLFDGFLIESLKEVENDEGTSTGDPKHWHLYHIVAKKR